MERFDTGKLHCTHKSDGRKCQRVQSHVDELAAYRHQPDCGLRPQPSAIVAHRLIAAGRSPRSLRRQTGPTHRPLGALAVPTRGRPRRHCRPASGLRRASHCRNVVVAAGTLRRFETTVANCGAVMSAYSSRYSFLTDDEALSFIRTMAGELRRLAEDRGFRPLMPSLTNAERTAGAMKCRKGWPPASP